MTDRNELIAIANTYLQQGLIEHKPDEVLVAENCVRMEMGMEMGGSGQQIKTMLKDPAYEANKAIVEAHWVVEAPWLDVRYTLELHGIEETMKIATRFKVEQGLIQHIEIIFNAGAMLPMILEINESLRTDKL